MSATLKIGAAGYFLLDGVPYARQQVKTIWGTNTLSIIYLGEANKPILPPTAYGSLLDGDNASAPFANFAALVTWAEANIYFAGATSSGGATSAKQDTGNTSLASIDGKVVLPSSLGQKTKANSLAVTIASDQDIVATSAKQDTGNTSLASIDGKIPAKGQSTKSGSTPVTIASDQDTLAVSIAAPTGATLFTLDAAAGTNATNVKSGASRLYGIVLTSGAGTGRAFKLYNKAGAPNSGDTPVMTLLVAAGTVVNIQFSTPVPFATGLSFATTMLPAQSDFNALTAHDMYIQLLYV